MKIHKPTMFFAYGLIVGCGLTSLEGRIGLWAVPLLIPAILIGVWLDLHTVQMPDSK